MKINQKYYDKINSEPFLVQETNSGNIEFYKLKDYPEIYNSTVGKGRFFFWCSKNTDIYKLLIEEEYYEQLKELYGKRVNEVQLKFYTDIDSTRKSLMLKLFLPLAITVFILMALVSTFISSDSGMRMPLFALIIVTFVFINIVINKKTNASITNLNIDAIDKIKGILGAEKFESLLDKQEEYVQEFYRKQRAELGIEEPEDFTEESLDESVAIENNDEIENTSVEKDEVEETQDTVVEEVKETENNDKGE